jgi:hypothetical protein
MRKSSRARFAEAATGAAAEHPGPERILEERLRDFRRRNLWRAALRLSFAAALCNEAYRWGSIFVGAWLDIAFPQVNVGPYFLAAGFLLARRRWSPEYTAARADDVDRFLNRYVSFLDFAHRPEVAAAFRDAQARESVQALAGAPPWGRHPARTVLLAGPVLLAVSMTYPMLAITPIGAPSLRGPGGGGRYRLTDGPGGTSLPPSHLETREEESRSAKKSDPGPPRTESGPERQDPPRPADVAEKRPAGPGDKPAPTGAASSEAELVPATQRVTAREPRIVDPVFTPGEETRGKATPQIRGSVNYRLLPANRDRATDRGSAGKGTAGEAGRGSLVIDYDRVPEEYRALVRSYFDRLAQVVPAPPAGERRVRD